MVEAPTPMLKQYHSIKAQHKDCILFFRLGDFYEMFYEDAQKASGILDLVLTSRGSNKSERVPMCGIPFHAADSYISRLIKAGLKVAVCEQVEDPALAKGIVKRGVIRIITSSTFIDDNNADPRYLLSISPNKETTGVAFTDTTSCVIHANQYAGIYKIIEVISKLSAHECIFPANQEDKVKQIFSHPLLKIKNITLSPHFDWCFNPEIAKKALYEHFQIQTLKGFGIDEKPEAIASTGALLEYLKQMNKQPMRHINKVSLYADNDYIFISPAAVYGLELEQLRKTIDQTSTPMGKRKFKYWIYHPLNNPEKILQRQQVVTFLKENLSVQEELNKLMLHTPDIEKSLARISCGYTNSKDLLALRNTLEKLPRLQQVLQQNAARENSLLAIDDLPDLRRLLEEAVNPDIPLSNPEGKIIRKGYNQELDSLRGIQEDRRQWLKNLQAEEIKRTGINSLKIGFNKIFGYYIEITRANLANAPADYICKQTLVNAGRFITPQLKEFEEKMLTAEEKVLRIEKEIVNQIQVSILDNSSLLNEFIERIAVIDALCSLSALALSNGYIIPKITDDTEIIITEGRHPVVEHAINEPFVANDSLLDCKDNHLLIITGPNMAGKSTYIRQTALLVIMAQMGSYIPAQYAKIGIVDKIFTRIGAHDEITKGQSTFMVEMSEAADILNNLSSRSLLILDEIGRGTSTFDGLSLAWAIAEYLAKHKVRALFATHFHELTALADELPGVKNYNVSVKKWQDEIIFMHKIIPGGTDDSYGLYVAKLAGMPQDVIQRSKQILNQLETREDLKEKIRGKNITEKQLSFLTETNDSVITKIKQELQNIDINSLTPLEALNKISEWKKQIIN